MLASIRGRLIDFAHEFARVHRSNRGAVTLTALAGACVMLVVFIAVTTAHVPAARADNVATSVTVLNTPPVWVVASEGRESVASATTTPTNAGQVITWIGTADDSSGDAYYMIICKTAAAPTANASAAPSCNGGLSNQWAVSASTADNVQASAATTTINTYPFDAEKNDWWAWVCDSNSALPRCYTTYSQGETHGDQGSPFVINHVPVFASVSNDSPEDPGGSVTWTSVSLDNDSLGGSQDQVQLIVCRAAGFSTTTGCTNGSWATSTLATTNAATTTDLDDPMRDGTYAGYVYLMDNHGLAATSTFHGFNSSFVVNNITPTVSAATISLEDVDGSGPLTLATPNGQTTSFRVEFITTDQNSCLNLASGNELSSAIANVYRSGVGQSSCDASGEYNANQCYPQASPYFSPHISCVQDTAVDTCSGTSDPTVGWTCTFSLWYVADPTDGASAADTEYFAENWLASVQISDDDYATSTLTEDADGTEMGSFLAFNVTETLIGYEALEPGATSTQFATTTDLLAYGNIGLDEDVYGDTMCPTSFWTAFDSCDWDGFQAARDIVIENQKFATSSVVYEDPEAYELSGSTTPVTLTVNVPKTTATSSPETRDTYWGISIPIAITTAGAYEGQNTITAIKSDPAFW